jgi:CheY-like chemotaxis protein
VEAASPRKRLRVVDDEPGFRGFVQDAAADLGPEVRSASNGANAREVYLAFRPGIILLDIVMPEVDGLEFMCWLAQQRTTSRLILVTGSNPNFGESATKLAAALGLSYISFLAKPVRLNTLGETLGEPDPSAEEGRSR